MTTVRTESHKRFIPVLLTDRNRRLVKTVRFGPRTYIGDPFNVVRLFNEKEVDELVVLDIDAAKDGRSPDLGFLRELSSECFMPLAYGGGITDITHCESLSRIGVEKCVLGYGAYNDDLVKQAARSLGSQAVVACIDFVGQGAAARCVSHSAGLRHDVHPLGHANRLVNLGVGEIILQSVERDGERGGIDLFFCDNIARQVPVPVVALGGAGELSHLMAAANTSVSAVASGSAFCFFGRLRAVLVSYPTQADIDQAMSTPQ